MSNEMNLYKRCKNIFKAHGADMGGGGGELDIIVDISNADSPVLIKGDYEAISAKIGHDTVTGLVKYTMEESGEIVHGSGSIIAAIRETMSTEEVIRLVVFAGNLLSLNFYPDGTIELTM